MKWKVNAPSLLKEIADNSRQDVLRTPLQIFMGILAEVAMRASEINDPQMNALMCRLALYSISDPYDPDYDGELTRKIIEDALESNF